MLSHDSWALSHAYSTWSNRRCYVTTKHCHYYTAHGHMVKQVLLCTDGALSLAFSRLSHGRTVADMWQQTNVTHVEHTVTWQSCVASDKGALSHVYSMVTWSNGAAKWRRSTVAYSILSHGRTVRPHDDGRTWSHTLCHMMTEYCHIHW